MGWKNVNWYIQTWIYFELHLWDYKAVEVIKDGKKTMMTQGRLQIELDGELKEDYSGRFKGPFMQKVKTFYSNYIVFHYIDNIWGDQLWYHILKLQTRIKEHLGMTTPENVSESRW